MNFECHARNVNQEQTHASTAFNVNDVANWLMRSLIHDRKIYLEFREKRFNPCLKKKKKKVYSIWQQKIIWSSFLFSLPFLFSIQFFWNKRILLSRAEKRDREKEKSSFHELNKFRNLTNRVFFTLFSLSRLIKYHYMENEIIECIFFRSSLTSSRNWSKLQN